MSEIVLKKDPKQASFTCSDEELVLWRTLIYKRYYLSDIDDLVTVWEDRDCKDRIISIKESSEYSLKKPNVSISKTVVSVQSGKEKLFTITLYYNKRKDNTILIQGNRCLDWIKDEFEHIEDCVKQIHADLKQQNEFDESRMKPIRLPQNDSCPKNSIMNNSKIGINSAGKASKKMIKITKRTTENITKNKDENDTTPQKSKRKLSYESNVHSKIRTRKKERSNNNNNEEINNEIPLRENNIKIFIRDKNMDGTNDQGCHSLMPADGNDPIFVGNPEVTTLDIDMRPSLGNEESKTTLRGTKDENEDHPISINQSEDVTHGLQQEDRSRAHSDDTTNQNEQEKQGNTVCNTDFLGEIRKQFNIMYNKIEKSLLSVESETENCVHAIQVVDSDLDKLVKAMQNISNKIENSVSTFKNLQSISTKKIEDIISKQKKLDDKLNKIEERQLKHDQIIISANGATMTKFVELKDLHIDNFARMEHKFDDVRSTQRDIESFLNGVNKTWTTVENNAKQAVAKQHTGTVTKLKEAETQNNRENTMSKKPYYNTQDKKNVNDHEKTEHQRRNCIRITNLNETKQENLLEKFMNILSILQIYVHKNDIVDIYRSGRQLENQSRPIIVQFHYEQHVNKILNKKSQLRYTEEFQKVHLNEYLTKEQSDLFQRCLMISCRDIPIPTITVSPSSPVEIGSTITLMCHVTYSLDTEEKMNEPKLDWNITHTNASFLLPTQRTIHKSHTATVTHSLVIDPVQCHHNNTSYECSVSAHDLWPKTKTATAFITVFKNSQEPTSLFIIPKEIAVGEPTTISCSGNVGRPSKHLDLFFIKHGWRSRLIIPVTDRKNELSPDDSCTTIQTVVSVFTFTKYHYNLSVLCGVASTNLSISTDLTYSALFPILRLNQMPENTNIPTIDTSPNVHANIGSSLSLTCRVAGKTIGSQPELEWVYNTNDLAFSTVMNEVTVTKEGIDSTSTLKLGPVRCSHDGFVYSCYRHTTKGMLSAETTVTVISSNAKTTLSLVMEPDEIAKEKVTNITCTANVGDPKQQLELYIQKNTINESRLYLPITLDETNKLNDSCLVYRTVKSVFMFDESHSDYDITCGVKGTKLSKSMDLLNKETDKSEIQERTSTNVGLIVHVAVIVIIGLVMSVGAAMYMYRRMKRDAEARITKAPSDLVEGFRVQDEQDLSREITVQNHTYDIDETIDESDASSDKDIDTIESRSLSTDISGAVSNNDASELSNAIDVKDATFQEHRNRTKSVDFSFLRCSENNDENDDGNDGLKKSEHQVENTKSVSHVSSKFRRDTINTNLVKAKDDLCDSSSDANTKNPRAGLRQSITVGHIVRNIVGRSRSVTRKSVSTEPNSSQAHQKLSDRQNTKSELAKKRKSEPFIKKSKEGASKMSEHATVKSKLKGTGFKGRETTSDDKTFNWFGSDRNSVKMMKNGSDPENKRKFSHSHKVDEKSLKSEIIKLPGKTFGSKIASSSESKKLVRNDDKNDDKTKQRNSDIDTELAKLRETNTAPRIKSPTTSNEYFSTDESCKGVKLVK